MGLGVSQHARRGTIVNLADGTVLFNVANHRPHVLARQPPSRLTFGSRLCVCPEEDEDGRERPLYPWLRYYGNSERKTGGGGKTTRTELLWWVGTEQGNLCCLLLWQGLGRRRLRTWDPYCDKLDVPRFLLSGPALGSGRGRAREAIHFIGEMDVPLPGNSSCRVRQVKLLYSVPRVLLPPRVSGLAPSPCPKVPWTSTLSYCSKVGKSGGQAQKLVADLHTAGHRTAATRRTVRRDGLGPVTEATGRMPY